MALLLPKRTLVIGGVLVAVGVLYILGADKQHNQQGQGTSPTANSAQCRVSVTADILNVRATPALNGTIVGKLQRGQESDADKVVQNGFRKLADNRWVSTDFTKPLTGRDCG
jgi:hypothetical protein